MNKFSFLTYVLLSLTLTIQVEKNSNFVETLYDKSILIIKGMSEQNYTCYNTFVSNKTEILPVVNKIINLFQNPSSFPSPIEIGLILASLGEVYDEIRENCDLDYLLGILLKFYDDENRIKLIEQYGKNIVNNIELFYSGSSNFVKERGIDAKLALVGKITRAITNFTFH